MKFHVIGFAAAVLFAGCDCGHDHHAHARRDGHGCRHEHGAGHGHGEKKDAHRHGAECSRGHAGRHDAATKTVRVPIAVQRVMGLETVRAEMRAIGSTLTFPGRYELEPEARLTVASPVAGRLEIAVKPLSAVKKGDRLFTVSSPDLVARAREIAVLEKRLAVYRGIGNRNAQLENTLAVKTAERLAMLAGAEEKDGVVTVRADADGIVEEYVSGNGQWMETGTGVLRLVRPRLLRFKALAAASDALRLKDGMKAEVDGISGSVRIGTGDGSGLVPVYVVFGGEVRSVAGARATAFCMTGQAEEPRAAVPAKSIFTSGAQPSVFVKDGGDPERFIVVPVVPGASAAGWTAVEGLPSKDAEIVVDGAYELKLALPGGESKPAGHFHADGTFHEGEH